MIVSREPRRHSRIDQNVAILRRHHVDKVAVSQLCEENDLQPSLFNCWQKKLFENAATALQPQAPVARSKSLEAKVEALEKQVAKKDAVIASISEEYVAHENALGEP